MRSVAAVEARVTARSTTARVIDLEEIGGVGTQSGTRASSKLSVFLRGVG
jgi:hypothetical protein